MSCRCNGYNGNCSCNEPITLAYTGPTGANGATGPAGADGYMILFDSATSPVGNTAAIIVEETLVSYTIDNTPTEVYDNGDMCIIEAYFRVAVNVNQRELRIRINGVTTVCNYIIPGNSIIGKTAEYCLRAEIHKNTSVGQKIKATVHTSGVPGSFYMRDYQTVAFNFAADVIVSATCVCDTAAATNDVVCSYLKVEKVKHI